MSLKTVFLLAENCLDFHALSSNKIALNSFAIESVTKRRKMTWSDGSYCI